ncbi:MAG: molybdopterin-dependent oxidoreductase, partial [Desulfuromonadales bacterium]|nr:molybdopterin-dependent oxidoreductase [Desulfuromonadales bacterium]NIS44166.1 molybdopterin-dependent oxidoreductase [Desulfuromonadales bacterium]
PRYNATSRFADLHLQINAGYDMHLLNAIAQVLVEEDMVDREHLEYCALRKGLKNKGEFI